MNTLAEMFELEKPVVHSIISKMIINEELMVRYINNNRFLNKGTNRTKYILLISVGFVHPKINSIY